MSMTETCTMCGEELKYDEETEAICNVCKALIYDNFTNDPYY
jgi:transcription initiation factor IIE alpha subunit